VPWRRSRERGSLGRPAHQITDADHEPDVDECHERRQPSVSEAAADDEVHVIQVIAEDRHTDPRYEAE
jgi:hypothetical protein